jgi:hypothetical protein
MSNNTRIVLCDAEGDELFSGDSLLSEPPPPPEDEEPIPETLRSHVLEDLAEPVSRPIYVEDADLSAA